MLAIAALLLAPTEVFKTVERELTDSYNYRVPTRPSFYRKTKSRIIHCHLLMVSISAMMRLVTLICVSFFGVVYIQFLSPCSSMALHCWTETLFNSNWIVNVFTFSFSDVRVVNNIFILKPVNIALPIVYITCLATWCHLDIQCFLRWNFDLLQPLSPFCPLSPLCPLCPLCPQIGRASCRERV